VFAVMPGFSVPIHAKHQREMTSADRLGFIHGYDLQALSRDATLHKRLLDQLGTASGQDEVLEFTATPVAVSGNDHDLGVSITVEPRSPVQPRRGSRRQTHIVAIEVDRQTFLSRLLRPCGGDHRRCCGCWLDRGNGRGRHACSGASRQQPAGPRAAGKPGNLIAYLHTCSRPIVPSTLTVDRSEWVGTQGGADRLTLQKSVIHQGGWYKNAKERSRPFAKNV